MELTRRDALAAAAAAAGAAGVTGVSRFDPPTADASERPPRERVLSVLTAAAEVLYPSQVEGHRQFVETYAIARLRGRESYREGMDLAVADLNATARDWFGLRFESLEPVERDRLLRDLGVDTAAADPDGALSERVRHYVVEDLLFAFYTAPAGGELVGIENPPGYPGGLESYRRARVDDSADTASGGSDGQAQSTASDGRTQVEDG
jgi:hypothetical protein